MYASVALNAVAVQSRGLAKDIKLAGEFGFTGIQIDMPEVADLVDRDGIDTVRALFTSASVIPGGWGLPNGWNGSDAEWNEGVKQLPRLAKTAVELGAHRVATWVWSGSNDRDFRENREFHLQRLRPIAAILHEQGISLGLEFLGPKTLRDQFRYPFISTSEEMLALCHDLNPNVGLLLDCWHWYTSKGNVKDLRELTLADVVMVHINDAPSDVAIDDQVDNQRTLPGATGVIDIVTFLRALQAIGYAGPVIAEPMHCGLDALRSDDARLKSVRESMSRVMAAAGIVEAPEG